MLHCSKDQITIINILIIILLIINYTSFMLEGKVRKTEYMTEYRPYAERPNPKGAPMRLIHLFSKLFLLCAFKIASTK